MNMNIRYWNILKGLGIIAVVIGHTVSPLGRYVYMYHLALFFYASGFLYKDTYSLSPGKFAVRKIKSLYLPYIKYGLFFLLLHNVFIRIHVYSGEEIPKLLPTHYLSAVKNTLLFKNIEQLAGAMWFIIVLLIVCMLFCLIRYFCITYSQNHSTVLTIIIVFFLYLAGFSTKEMSMYGNVALIVLPVYLTGFLIKKYNIELPFHWSFLAISMFIVITICHFVGQIELSRKIFLNPAAFLAASMAGIYVNLYASKILNKYEIPANFISYLGEKSLSIMALHFLAFKIVSFAYIHYYGMSKYLLAKFPTIPGVSWVAYVIIGLTIPLLCERLIREILKFSKMSIINEKSSSNSR